MARWRLWAALAAALACGGGVQQQAERPACEPRDCVAAGAACGAVDDGCGNVLQCGECPAGQTCGANATPNVCGVGACQPTTCAAAQASCGTVPDGCGGTLPCGECPAGETCGGGGTPNACGAPACEKATCAGLGATCGTLPDGCGGELACGACGEGEACGAGGTPNACAPVPPTGAVGWVHATSTPGPDYAVGAGSDAAGNRFLLSFTQNEVGPNSTLRLEKLSRDGAPVWTKEWLAAGFSPWARHFRLAVTPHGSAYLAASAECFVTPCGSVLDVGGVAATDSVLVKLDPDGEVEWERDLAGSNLLALAANDGGALVARAGREAATSTVERYAADGALVATLSASAAAAALDAAGNVVAVDAGAVRKYSAAGALLWSRGLPGGGAPLGAATAGDGTIVVLASRDADVRFGTSEVRTGRQVLYVLEADGRARFARGISTWGSAGLAVDPAGRAAVTSDGNCGTVEVDAFDLSNADLWHRFLPDDARCWAGMSAGPSAYGADHRLFVTGSFGQPVEVGGRSFAPRGLDAMGVLLDP